METLLVFLAIIAVQAVAAYLAKQKKEAAKTAQRPLPSWQQQTESAQNQPKEIRKVVNHPPKEDPEFVEVKPTLHDHPADVRQRVSSDGASPFSILHSKINLKDPAQGILWAAILHEPRYKVRWKRR